MCYTNVCKYEGLTGYCLLDFRSNNVIILKDAACYDFTYLSLGQQEKENSNNPLNHNLRKPSTS